MRTSLRETLLAMQERDLCLRAELEADGTLFDGYHPRMEAVHRENARQLRNILERFGWPNERLAGRDGAEAAWLTAQHSISEPDFMRHCCELLEKEAASGGVPQWQHAYLEDRIRVFEGRSQRFGTQFDLTPEGPKLCEVEDINALDQLRQRVGLGPVAAQLERMAKEPLPTPAEYAAKKKAESEWRAKVGWREPRET